MVFLTTNFSQVIWGMPWPRGSLKARGRFREIPWQVKSWGDCKKKYFLSKHLDKLKHPV
jgi:hypothetical protein